MCLSPEVSILVMSQWTASKPLDPPIASHHNPRTPKPNSLTCINWHPSITEKQLPDPHSSIDQILSLEEAHLGLESIKGAREI